MAPSKTKREREYHRRDDIAAVELPPELEVERALDATQASAILNIGTGTLAHWRVMGIGPRWFRASAKAIRYRLGDVIEWRDARSVGESRDAKRKAGVR